MNKKIGIVALALIFAVCSNLSAKSLGLELDLGAVYTNHSHHVMSKNHDSAGFYHHHAYIKHLGGFNVGINYYLPKNWALYASTIFTFNRTFVNDTHLGIGYVFKPAKGFDLFLGGAFALGGSISTYSSDESRHYFNIGAGLSLVGSFMLTNKLGIFLGLNNTYYKPVAGSYNYKKTSKTYDANDLQDRMHQSVNIKAGVKIRF